MIQTNTLYKRPPVQSERVQITLTQEVLSLLDHLAAQNMRKRNNQIAFLTLEAAKAAQLITDDEMIKFMRAI